MHYEELLAMKGRNGEPLFSFDEIMSLAREADELRHAVDPYDSEPATIPLPRRSTVPSPRGVVVAKPVTICVTVAA